MFSGAFQRRVLQNSSLCLVMTGMVALCLLMPKISCLGKFLSLKAVFTVRSICATALPISVAGISLQQSSSIPYCLNLMPRKQTFLQTTGSVRNAF